MSGEWVAWVLLALLMLLAMNRFFVADIAMVIRGLYSRAERTYSDAMWQAKLLAWVYRIGVVAVIGYLCVWPDMTRSGVDYLLAVGVVALALLLRYAIARFVGYVFLDRRQIENSFEFRACICNAICALLWPVALVVRASGNEMLAMLLGSVMLGLWGMLLMWKGVQLYCKDLLSVFYILLYIISVEVFPILGTVFALKQLL
jgi:hypothetical protein